MKRLVIIVLALIFIPASRITKGQTLKLGFRIEPTFLLTELKNENSIAFTPYSFYLNIIVEPIEWFSFEVRPGYLLAGGEYGGFEIGAFTKFNILPSRFCLIVGLNNHSNDWGNAHNGGGSYLKKMFYYGVGIGFQKDSKLSFDVMYYWTDDKEFAYSFDGTFRKNKLMNGIVKLGFSLAWDIL